MSRENFQRQVVRFRLNSLLRSINCAALSLLTIWLKILRKLSTWKLKYFQRILEIFVESECSTAQREVWALPKNVPGYFSPLRLDPTAMVSSRAHFCSDDCLAASCFFSITFHSAESFSDFIGPYWAISFTCLQSSRALTRRACLKDPIEFIRKCPFSR